MAGIKGRSGRPPKPTSLLLLQGTARKKRHLEKRAGEPAVSGDGSLPPPPEDLSDEVLAAWEELAAAIEFKIFSAEDVHAFRTFAAMWATWKKCQEHVEQNGVTEEKDTKHGTVKQMTSEARIWMELNSKLLLYFSRFGMTPADRSRVRELGGKNGHKEEDPDDEFGASSA
jgi:P27 family predicted phage terminase small subunit